MNRIARGQLRRRHRLLPALCAALCILLVAAPAGTQEDPTSPTEPSSGASLVLVDQSPPIAPGGRFTVTVEVPPERGIEDLSLRLHRPVNGWIQFENSIAGSNLGAVLHTAPAARVSAGTATIHVDLSSEELAGSSVQREGVYPVSVVARDAEGATVDSLVTHLVLQPPTTDTSRPLLVAPVLRLGAPPWIQPDETAAIPDTEFAELQVAAEALAAHPDVALTMQIVPETLHALELGDEPEHQAVLEQLRTARELRPILPAPFVRVDTGAWLADGLHEQLAQQRSLGGEVLERVLGEPIDPGTMLVDDHSTTAEIQDAARRGVRHLVPVAGWVTDAPDQETPRRGPAPLSGSDTTVVLLPDPIVRDDLADRAQPVLAAHHTIAALMVHYFELPGTERGEALILDAELSGKPGYLDALLAGLAASDRLEAVTLAAFASRLEVDDAASPLRPDLTRPTTTGTLADDLAAARAGRAAVSSTFVEEQQSGELALLVAASADLSRAERVGYLQAADAELAEAARNVHAPDGQTVTLTAQTADIPIVVENALGRPVRVQVHFDSDKLDFPDGNERIAVLQPGVNRMDIAVRTRATGAFPLRVELRTPEGDLELSTVRMHIRSTAISGLGLALSIGAGIFLVAWWARHWRDTRRSRRLVSPRHPALSTLADPSTLDSEV